ncbi:AAA family ATPase, partial [bacterium]|nr:AAA family ATPase [bacterium]
SNIIPGTGFYSLDTTDKKTGITSELVNDGFGVNQLVYALTSMLDEDNKTICIEEPEIHLHPSAIRSFCQTLAVIQKEEGKHFIISTHSEVLISALLALVAGGKLEAENLACYHAVKTKKATNFERQSINEKGQIEGGLATFIEAELEDLKTFLKVSD